MTEYVGLSRDPVVVEDRKVWAGLYAGEGMPECVGDFAVRFVTHVSAHGPCGSCSSRTACDAGLGHKYHQLSSPPLKCLGDISVRGVSASCSKCRRSDDCMAIIDEHIYRSNPGIGVRYAIDDMPTAIGISVEHSTTEPAITPSCPSSALSGLDEPKKEAPPYPVLIPTLPEEAASGVGLEPPVPVTTAPGVGLEPPVPVASVTTVAAGYQFPRSDPGVVLGVTRFQSSPSKYLLDLLDAMAFKLLKSSLTPAHYLSIRPYVIAISLVLNERKVCPPRFRQFRTPPPKSTGEGSEPWASLLSNDRQVIDLHWLSCNDRSFRPRGRWSGIFAETGFDFVMASRFVATVGDHETKLDELGIHADERVQFAALQTKAMAGRWRDIKAQDKVAMETFRKWVADNASTTDTADDLSLQFRVLQLVGQNYAHAARLVDQCNEKKTLPKTMQRRWGLFHKWGLLRRVTK